MLKRGVLMCALGLLALGVSSCIFDPPTPAPVKPPKTTTFYDLTEKQHVLLNIEAAYNVRRIDKYDQVLDPNFTFFLSPGDVGGGLPDQWDRAEEILLNTRLFDKNYAALPCQAVFMDIRTEEGLSWTSFNPASAPTETWYSTTVYYDFKFEISPNTYIPLPGAKAVFTVRDVGTASKPHWQLVEFRDLGGAA